MKKRGILVCAILFFVCVAGGIGYVTLCNQNSRLPQEPDGPPVRPEPEEIEAMLTKYGRVEIKRKKYNYQVTGKENKNSSKELLFILEMGI